MKRMTKRLALDKQTLRPLTGDELERTRGGYAEGQVGSRCETCTSSSGRPLHCLTNIE